MRWHTVAAIVLWVMTAAWMLVIFQLSAQPASESSQVSSSVTETIVSIITPDYELLSPEEQQQLVDRWHDPIRKLAHVTEYAVLGVLLMGSLLLSRVSARLSTILAVAVSLLYAAGDEIHQAFSEARGPGVGDVLIDLSGAVIGVSIFLLMGWLIRGIRRKKKKADEKI